jgi:CheY-like chemotaxis protein
VANSAPGVEINEKRRILILDNNREKTGDYLVLGENDSTKAQQSARNFRPDLIELDIVMLRADGGEIAAQIRADPDLQHTPIIFVTALVTRTEANAGLRIDGHPFLAKAIDIQELIKSIDENLSARASS